MTHDVNLDDDLNKTTILPSRHLVPPAGYCLVILSFLHDGPFKALQQPNWRIKLISILQMSSFSRQESSPHTMQSDLADRCQDAGCLATPATDKLCQRVQLWMCSHHTYKHDNKTLLRPEVPVGDTDTDTDTLHRWPSGLDSLCGGELGALLSMPRCGGKTSFLVALCAALGPQPATGSPSEAHTQYAHTDAEAEVEVMYLDLGSLPDAVLRSETEDVHAPEKQLLSVFGSFLRPSHSSSTRAGSGGSGKPLLVLLDNLDEACRSSSSLQAAVCKVLQSLHSINNAYLSGVGAGTECGRSVMVIATVTTTVTASSDKKDAKSGSGSGSSAATTGVPVLLSSVSFLGNAVRDSLPDAAQRGRSFLVLLSAVQADTAYRFTGQLLERLRTGERKEDEKEGGEEELVAILASQLAAMTAGCSISQLVSVVRDAIVKAQLAPVAAMAVEGVKALSVEWLYEAAAKNRPVVSSFLQSEDSGAGAGAGANEDEVSVVGYSRAKSKLLDCITDKACHGAVLHGQPGTCV